MIEWADHLSQHFEEPEQVRAGRYVTPRGAGASTAMRAEALAWFSPRWSGQAARAAESRRAVSQRTLERQVKQ